jgi:hypothetical protein
VSQHLNALIPIGFVIFCLGGLARTYMNISLDGWKSFVRSKELTEQRYRRLMKEQGAPAWPLIATVTFMPLGVVLVFGAIVWSNYLRAR